MEVPAQVIDLAAYHHQGVESRPSADSGKEPRCRRLAVGSAHCHGLMAAEQPSQQLGAVVHRQAVLLGPQNLRVGILDRRGVPDGPGIPHVCALVPDGDGDSGGFQGLSQGATARVRPRDPDAPVGQEAGESTHPDPPDAH